MGRGGDSLDALPSTSGVIAGDERFAPFLEDSFNATDFASSALAGAHATAQAQVEALQEGIRVLNGQLRAEIAKRHDSLLRGASRLGEAETSLANIKLAVGSLQSALRRVRTEIMDPYQQVIAIASTPFWVAPRLACLKVVAPHCQSPHTHK